MIQFNSKKILIPVDFSDTSLLAITHGAFTAQLTKGDVYLLHVINSYYVAQNLFLPTVDILNTSEVENKATEKLGKLAADIAKQYGVKVDCIVKTGSPSSEIVDVAEEIGASMVVMGTHGYSPIEELLIGSVAMKVLTKSSCPTIVMSKEANHKGYNKIVMPIDTSAHTRQKGLLPGMIDKYFEDKKAIRNVKNILRGNNLSPADVFQITRLIRNEISLNNRIERLHTMQKLFKNWHVAHLPFAIIMLIIMVIHVGITLAFGYRWIF